MRTIAIAPFPGGVAIATMVSLTGAPAPDRGDQRFRLVGA
jgi:hypothetical protein